MLPALCLARATPVPFGVEAERRAALEAQTERRVGAGGQVADAQPEALIGKRGRGGWNSLQVTEPGGHPQLQGALGPGQDVPRLVACPPGP